MNLPALDIRGKQSAILTLNVPAGAIVPGKAVGAFLYLVSCPVPVKIRIDGQPFIDAKQGTGLEVGLGSAFEWFEVWNTSSTDIVVKAYVGFARYVDQRLAVVDAQTEADGWSGSSIAATTAVDFSGVGTGAHIGRQRRSFLISNADASLPLQLRDAAGHVVLIVFAGTSITLPISGFVRVYNPNPSPVAAYVGELWWAPD